MFKVSVLFTEIKPSKFVIVDFGLNTTLYPIFEIDPPEVFNEPKLINEPLFQLKFTPPDVVNCVEEKVKTELSK